MDWLDTLNRASQRYLASETREARAALLEVEALLRRPDLRIPQRGFALALTLAKRSEIEACLGDTAAADTLLTDALHLFLRAGGGADVHPPTGAYRGEMAGGMSMIATPPNQTLPPTPETPGLLPSTGPAHVLAAAESGLSRQTESLL